MKNHSYELIFHSQGLRRSAANLVKSHRRIRLREILLARLRAKRFDMEVKMSFAETFKALSDPARRQILELLRQGPMSAGEIGSHFDMTGATISYHLKILKKADLVFETRDKNFIYYQLNTSVLEEIMLWISDLRGGDQDAESK